MRGFCHLQRLNCDPEGWMLKKGSCQTKWVKFEGIFMQQQGWELQRSHRWPWFKKISIQKMYPMAQRFQGGFTGCCALRAVLNDLWGPISPHSSLAEELLRSAAACNCWVNVSHTTAQLNQGCLEEGDPGNSQASVAEATHRRLENSEPFHQSF